MDQTEGSGPIFVSNLVTPSFHASSPGTFSPCQLLDSPSPPSPFAPQAMEGGNEGALPCCAPPRPPVALLWILLCPLSLLLFIPPLSPWLSSLLPTLHPPSFSSQLPCWAGDRPLNAGPGVPDGSYRWSVVIGPMEPCHRLFPAPIQKPGLSHSEKSKRGSVRG